MNEQQSPRDEMEKAREELEKQSAFNEAVRDIEGEYVQTFTEDTGARYYLEQDEDGQQARVYLGPGELPPKKGEEVE
jgi:hypothetical protein